MAKCDQVDGLKDGLIDDPRKCSFDPARDVPACSQGSDAADCLTAAQAGAAWAFEVLYRDLAPVVTAYLRLHGALEPDDLASETFIGVFTGLAGFSGDEDALRAWVFTIAHRRLVDDWRRRSRRPQPADDVTPKTLPSRRIASPP